MMIMVEDVEIVEGVICKAEMVEDMETVCLIWIGIESWMVTMDIGKVGKWIEEVTIMGKVKV